MGVNCARCSEDLSHTLQGVLILYSLEASSAPDKFSKPRRQPQPRQEWMQGLWGTSGPVWVRKVLAASKPLLWLPALCWRPPQNLASFGTFLWGTPMNCDRLCQEQRKWLLLLLLSDLDLGKDILGLCGTVCEPAGQLEVALRLQLRPENLLVGVMHYLHWYIGDCQIVVSKTFVLPANLKGSSGAEYFDTKWIHVEKAGSLWSAYDRSPDTKVWKEEMFSNADLLPISLLTWL